MRRTKERSARLSLVFATLAVALSGCAADRAATRDFLAQQAGFQAVPANTANGMALMQSLPKLRFVARTVGGQITYYYADPVVCGCVYSGNAAAYATLRQEILQRQLMRQEELQQLDAVREGGGDVNGAGIPLN